MCAITDCTLHLGFVWACARSVLAGTVPTPLVWGGALTRHMVTKLLTTKTLRGAGPTRLVRTILCRQCWFFRVNLPLPNAAPGCLRSRCLGEGGLARVGQPVRAARFAGSPFRCRAALCSTTVVLRHQALYVSWGNDRQLESQVGYSVLPQPAQAHRGEIPKYFHIRDLVCGSEPSPDVHVNVGLVLTAGESGVHAVLEGREQRVELNHPNQGGWNHNGQVIRVPLTGPNTLVVQNGVCSGSRKHHTFCNCPFRIAPLRKSNPQRVTFRVEFGAREQVLSSGVDGGSPLWSVHEESPAKPAPRRGLDHAGLGSVDVLGLHLLAMKFSSPSNQQWREVFTRRLLGSDWMWRTKLL